MAGWIKMPLSAEAGLDPGNIVLDGDPSPPKKGHSPQFSANVYYGQTIAHLSYCSSLVLRVRQHMCVAQSLTVYVMVRLCVCYTSVLCQYGRGCHQVINTGLQWKDSFFLNQTWNWHLCRICPIKTYYVEGVWKSEVIVSYTNVVILHNLYQVEAKSQVLARTCICHTQQYHFYWPLVTSNPNFKVKLYITWSPVIDRRL